MLFGGFFFGVLITLLITRIDFANHLACRNLSSTPNQAVYLYGANEKNVCFVQDVDTNSASRILNFLTLGFSQETNVLYEADQSSFYAPRNAGIAYDKNSVWTQNGKQKISISQLLQFSRIMDRKCLEEEFFAGSADLRLFCESYEAVSRDIESEDDGKNILY